MTAVQARIVAQCAGIGAGLAVALTPPVKVDAKSDVFCYLVHLMPPEDKIVVANAQIQRTHHIHIRLWMRTPDDTSETLFLNPFTRQSPALLRPLRHDSSPARLEPRGYRAVRRPDAVRTAPHDRQDDPLSR
jgi:hypothetical protein